MNAEAVGDAELLKQQENFTVMTPEHPDSNGYTNSLGSWKDSTDVQEPFDGSLAPRNKSDSYVGGADSSPGSWKDCAALSDTEDTNSLGSWKNGVNGQQPFDEALAPKNKLYSYVGGADCSSRHVKEEWRSKTFSSSKAASS
ncbi:putative chaperone protein dnaJ 11, chloroplastic-like, partial [Capsicum annuum]